MTRHFLHPKMGKSYQSGMVPSRNLPRMPLRKQTHYPILSLGLPRLCYWYL
uniref:Uncharacterized protein n=1 Tax=Rhizophora mucronata TaxID=61149 RepID=A0A2P2J9L8_RHIMU